MPLPRGVLFPGMSVQDARLEQRSNHFGPDGPACELL
jgi:hypothetical protein